MRAIRGLIQGRAGYAARHVCDRSTAPAPIGIVMLNMGGPSSLEGPEDGVQPFLERLFCDKEIIKMGPLQKYLVRASGA